MTFVITWNQVVALIMKLPEPESIPSQSLKIWTDAKPRVLVGSGFRHIFISGLCLNIFIKCATLIPVLLSLLNSVTNADAWEKDTIVGSSM